jgi:hypothetical protein
MRKEPVTTESNIRAKASRRGYRVGKYRAGYDSKFVASHWQSSMADIWDASLEELEEFINSKPLERATKGGPR